LATDDTEVKQKSKCNKQRYKLKGKNEPRITRSGAAGGRDEEVGIFECLVFSSQVGGILDFSFGWGQG
jgi:hypothetical protein